jgi:hypothetical protein
MELLGDVRQVEARFSPLGDNVNLDARLVHGLHQVLIMAQHRCTVWDERAIGFEIILDTPNGTPG